MVTHILIHICFKTHTAASATAEQAHYKAERREDAHDESRARRCGVLALYTNTKILIHMHMLVYIQILIYMHMLIYIHILIYMQELIHIYTYTFTYTY
jgi:hypothetical protein